MTNLVLIGAGGALGAISRHLAGKAALRWFGPDYTWGTFGVFSEPWDFLAASRRFRLSPWRSA